MLRGNFAENLPDASAGEIIEVFAGRKVTVERITSGGHPTPDGEIYDQPADEWVMLTKGSARIAFENPGTGEFSEEILSEYDWLLIPARTRHRVTYTSPDAVWLAVHGDFLGNFSGDSHG